MNHTVCFRNVVFVYSVTMGEVLIHISDVSHVTSSSKDCMVQLKLCFLLAVNIWWKQNFFTVRSEHLSVSLNSGWRHVKLVVDAEALEQLFSSSSFLRFSPANHHSTIDPFPSFTVRWPWPGITWSHPHSLTKGLYLSPAHRWLKNKKLISLARPNKPTARNT